MLLGRDYIESRVFEIAKYILDTNCTVRAAARKFEVSKSTVHKDLVERLPHLSQSLADDVRKVLDENKAERHIRGGLATKAKYEAERERERKNNMR
ncbi:MAG: sporulation transcriptional regulator SpoIIID [Clostridia bacterium]|nr:sporulation transcriptional regulator SpoIIID [Clostridia bacterium]